MVLRRPPRNEWLAYVPWRAWFRLPALGGCIVAAIGGLGYAIFGLTQLIRFGSSNDSIILVLTGLLLAVLGPAFWAVLASGELLIARAGLFVGLTFIPWRDVSEIRDDAVYLYVVTPSLRAYWNSWTGTLRIPKILFDVPDDFGDQLNVWAHQAAGAR